MIRFGVYPLPVAGDATSGRDSALEAALRAASESGFDGVALGPDLPGDAAALKASLNAQGLDFVAGRAPLNLISNGLEDELAAMETRLDALETAGARMVIACEMSNAVHRRDTPLNDKPVLGEDAWAGFGAGIDALAERCADRGLPLVYRPQAGTVVETPDEVARLMAATGPKTRLAFDTGQCLLGGGDPANEMMTYIPRIGLINATNPRIDVMGEVRGQGLSFAEGVRRGLFTLPGDPKGCIAFGPIMAIAGSGHYDGWLMIEAPGELAAGGEDCTAALEHLRDLAREAGLNGEV